MSICLQTRVGLPNTISSDKSSAGTADHKEQNTQHRVETEGLPPNEAGSRLDKIEGVTTMQKIRGIAFRVAQAVVVVVSIAIASGASTKW